MTELFAPADVATGVQRYLRNLGFDARAKVPLDREPRLVRVSRVSGTPSTAKTEATQVLIEVWDETQRDAFQLARELWARFAAISRENQEAIPGIRTYEVVPAMPVEYPDEQAPLLSRHQFTVDMIVEFDRITIEEKEVPA